jgi:hypothetical protein
MGILSLTVMGALLLVSMGCAVAQGQPATAGGSGQRQASPSTEAKPVAVTEPTTAETAGGSGSGEAVRTVIGAPSSLFPDGSVFCVDRGANGVRMGPCAKQPNHQSFDVAAIEFGDGGALVDRTQLSNAAACIEQARKADDNGVLVVLFIHGWHHNARWDVDQYATDWDADVGDDQHFRQFRRILMGLAVRESERYLENNTRGRRVIGVYLGWNGDPTSWIGAWLSRTDHLTHLSFYNRYREAEAVGGGRDLREVIRTIVEATKKPITGKPESPLVLSGHSMGALVLEGALLALLHDQDPALSIELDPHDPATNSRSGLEVTLEGKRMAFPDLLLALNSAADSRILGEILEEVKRRKLTKSLAVEGFRYAPPLLVSVTSSADRDTGFYWPLAWMIAEPWSTGDYTDGHDPRRWTHSFTAFQPNVRCAALPGKDFGQDWHCLRHPFPPQESTPSFAIDLPMVSRKEFGGPIHARYRLTPLHPGVEQLAWVFQVPKEVIGDHNDVFNARSNLLFMALTQISGAVMSLASDFGKNFEAE